MDYFDLMIERREKQDEAAIEQAHEENVYQSRKCFDLGCPSVPFSATPPSKRTTSSTGAPTHLYSL
jgi:hypothetical protein